MLLRILTAGLVFAATGGAEAAEIPKEALEHLRLHGWHVEDPEVRSGVMFGFPSAVDPKERERLKEFPQRIAGRAPEDTVAIIQVGPTGEVVAFYLGIARFEAEGADVIVKCLFLTHDEKQAAVRIPLAALQKKEETCTVSFTTTDGLQFGHWVRDQKFTLKRVDLPGQD